jgi:hypothetical protein
MEAGTLLYLVFNMEGRIGWCPPKDRSGANQARTLFIPALDRRPCLTDSDGDGRLDSSFSVYDKYGGPPTVRGSINAARPVGTSVGFAEADVHDFPADMRMLMEFTGARNDPRRARIRLSFTRPISGSWPDVPGVAGPDGTIFRIGNIGILLRSLSPEGRATFEIATRPDLFISTDNRNTLYWDTLPPFLASR